jgi:hypothetical protein
MSVKKPLPKSQRELSTGSPDKPSNRANDIRRDDDTSKNFSVGLYDIDNVIKYYFDNTIKPYVIEDNTSVRVPVIYGSPEKWKSVDADAYYRDKDGKIITPLISYKRTSITRNKSLTNKVDANYPQVYYSQPVRYNNKNKYDQFSVLTNAKPVIQYVNTVVPDYVDLSYDVIVWTNYVEQMNKIVEAIIYTEGTYWGDEQRFKFRTKVDSYTNTTDLLQDSDRIVRTSFQLTLFGYLIPETVAKEKSEKLSEKTYSTRRVVVDTVIQNETKANSIASPESAVIYNAHLNQMPNSYRFIINGKEVSSTAVKSISYVGSNTVILFDVGEIGYTLAPGDNITVIDR